MNKAYENYDLERLHRFALGESTSGMDPEWRHTINRLHRDHRKQLLGIIRGFERKMFPRVKPGAKGKAR
jgi:hypothetical protein